MTVSLTLQRKRLYYFIFLLWETNPASSLILGRNTLETVEESFIFYPCRRNGNDDRAFLFNFMLLHSSHIFGVTGSARQRKESREKRRTMRVSFVWWERGVFYFEQNDYWFSLCVRANYLFILLIKVLGGRWKKNFSLYSVNIRLYFRNVRVD